jgi:exopolyphosphatase/guanosine-5'-triphosphate,3'-diphosphate pyrophosphatase
MASSRLAVAEPVGIPSAPASGGLAVIGGGAPRDAAVIDLGSNSFRLVAYEYVPGGWWRRTGQLQEPVRVAAGLEASGRLSRAGMKRGLQTLEMFACYCRARGLQPEHVEAVATSAVRDAANGRELVAAARAATGFAIRVLSAEEEANCGYLAAVNSTTLTDGAVLDLGGGSLQLVAVRDRAARELGSWPLGAVRVTESLLPGRAPVSRKELKRARMTVRRELADADWLADSGPRLVAVGGAVRNLAAAAQRASSSDAAGLQGYVLRAGELRGLVATLAALPARARALPGIKPARADIILGAAVVLEAALDVGGFDGIEVTRAGLREGLFFDTRCSRVGRRSCLTSGRPQSATSRSSMASTSTTPSTWQAWRFSCTSRWSKAESFARPRTRATS